MTQTTIQFTVVLALQANICGLTPITIFTELTGTETSGQVP